MMAADAPSQGADLREERNSPSLPDLNEAEWYSRPVAAMALLIGSGAALIFCIIFSTSVGAADVPLAEVWHAVFSYNPSNTNHIIIHEVRLPRVVAGAMVGVAFAVAGAIMQGMTRNPLASPSLMGLNAGAYFMITLGLVFLPWLTLNGLLRKSPSGSLQHDPVAQALNMPDRPSDTQVRVSLIEAVSTQVLISSPLLQHMVDRQGVGHGHYGPFASLARCQTVVLGREVSVPGMAGSPG